MDGNRCSNCNLELIEQVPILTGKIIKNMPCGCVYSPEKNTFVATGELKFHDPVNHPKHYNNSPAKCDCGRRIECIDVTRHMNFNLGNAIKYIWRAADKNGTQDLEKARWYLDDYIKQEQLKTIKVSDGTS